MTDLMDELRAALLAEHDDHHPISFAEGCGCETCQLLLRVWEHDHAPEQHITEFRLDGWSIQHPRACRPNLLDCEVHKLVREEVDSWEDGVVPMAHGRYVTTVDHDGPVLLNFDVEVARSVSAEVRCRAVGPDFCGAHDSPWPKGQKRCDKASADKATTTEEDT